MRNDAHLRGYELVDGELLPARPIGANGSGCNHHRDGRAPGRPSWELLTAIVLRLHHDKIIACARRCLSSQHVQGAVEPEDLVQQALTLLLTDHLEWRGSLERLLLSLFTTIHNLSRDVRKAEQRRRPRATGEPVELATPHAPDADEAARRVQRKRDVDAALGGLPEKMRAVAIGYWLEGSTAREVASDCGISESTVRNQLARARSRLEGELEHRRRG